MAVPLIRVRAALRMIAVAGLVATAGCDSAALDHAEVAVGGQSFRVEVARTAAQQQQGLSERSSVPAGSGMLFDFSGRRPQKVWMADTRMPLDVAWVADDELLAIRTLQPCREADTSDCPTWTSPQPVDALLEVPAGALAGVPVGSRVRVRELDG